VVEVQVTTYSPISKSDNFYAQDIFATDLSKREVLMRWRLWDEKGTRAILIAEPNWFRRQHAQANG